MGGTMRRLRYSVAMSLDGYIADAKDGFDWILHDDTVDFGAMFARVDTFLLGRRTYEMMRAQENAPSFKPGARVYAASRTLAPVPDKGVTAVSSDPVALAST